MAKFWKKHTAIVRPRKTSRETSRWFSDGAFGASNGSDPSFSASGRGCKNGTISLSRSPILSEGVKGEFSRRGVRFCLSSMAVLTVDWGEGATSGFFVKAWGWRGSASVERWRGRGSCVFALRQSRLCWPSRANFSKTKTLRIGGQVGRIITVLRLFFLFGV